ncbi:hypothetical protein V8G54_023358 [Vigna mungo]|uniref:Uncharacterized protein n=1 Tax=Vigna mungo TaxID=3915 RepID=A0AAQ3RQ84_VIGMU
MLNKNVIYTTNKILQLETINTPIIDHKKIKLSTRTIKTTKRNILTHHHGEPQWRTINKQTIHKSNIMEGPQQKQRNTQQKEPYTPSNGVFQNSANAPPAPLCSINEIPKVVAVSVRNVRV